MKVDSQSRCLEVRRAARRVPRTAHRDKLRTNIKNSFRDPPFLSSICKELDFLTELKQFEY